MLRFLPATMLSMILCASAQASGRSDLRAGYDALLHHDYETAIALLTNAIETGDLSRDNLALAYHYRGAEYLKAARPDEAIADLDRAIAIAPSRYPTAYSDRGIAYRRKGDYAKAIADYSEAIRLWPDWHDWYLNRGLAYAANGQYQEAISDYDRTLYYRPRLVSAYVARADAFLRQGRKGEALGDYRSALRADADLFAHYPGVAAKMAGLDTTP
ncbi:MAG TPA: tetratricopeptide repeat protein [Micropepsaceae bacterium]|nr:tetratricopeptide repeat protein [Micropepsaceae bacterium]